MLNTQGISEILDPGLRKIFFEVGKERPLEYPSAFNVSDMDWNPMTDRNAAGLGPMTTKLEGQQFPLDQPIMGNTKVYTAVPYGMAFEASWEIWRDDMYGFLTILASQLARSARNRQEVQAWLLLNNGFTSGTGFDGVVLFSTAHVGLDGVTRVNRPSPDIGISVTGVQQMIQDFEGLTDDRNLPWLKAPRMVIVTPTNKFTAREVLGSSSKPFTANNEHNSLLEEDMSWMVSHYITTGTNWFATSGNGEHDLWFLWRDQPMFDSFDDPRTKTAVFTAYQRFVADFGEWRGWWGSTG